MFYFANVIVILILITTSKAILLQTRQWIITNAHGHVKALSLYGAVQRSVHSVAYLPPPLIFLVIPQQLHLVSAALQVSLKSFCVS